MDLIGLTETEADRLLKEHNVDKIEKEYLLNDLQSSANVMLVVRAHVADGVARIVLTPFIFKET